VYAIAVFKSRKECMDFNSRLCSAGVSGRIINTPRCLSKSCCLSAKFPITYLVMVKRIINALKYATFDGFYRDDDSAVKIFI